MMNINTVAHLATVKNVGMHHLVLTTFFNHHQNREEKTNAFWWEYNEGNLSRK